jgi:hypothetical protein
MYTKESCMLVKPLTSVWCALLFFILGGCAQLDAWTDANFKHNDADASAGGDTPVNKRFINPDAPAYVAGFRNIYIAPANLANMQVIQPEGAPADSEWWVTEEEDTLLQRAIALEYTLALTHQSDFTIVTDRAQAQLVINTAVLAIHPHVTRASVAKHGKTGGLLTVSVAIVDAASGAVLVRAVDTWPSDDIWAFNQMSGDDPARDKIFADVGAEIRQGILQLQGRPEQSPLPNRQH